MIPTCADLASAPLTHRIHDVWNPPGLTNFRGSVQADRDLTGLRNLTFPPLTTSDFATGSLFIGGRYFPAFGAPVTYTWRPDRLVRSARVDDLDLVSATILPFGKTAAIVGLTIRNLSAQARDVDLSFAVSSTITNAPKVWDEYLPPFEELVAHVADDRRPAFIFHAGTSQAVHVQGLVSPAGATTGERRLETTLRLEPGEKTSVGLVHAIGTSVDEATALFDELATDVRGEFLRNEREWDAELAAIFDPEEQDRWSGSLPVLETDSEELKRLYWTGILGVAYFKRESPHGVRPRAYDTLMPRHWITTTFLWDYSISGLIHALLDPAEMRDQLEHWVSTDIHSCMGTSWLTGEGLGAWYSVNDYAMTRLIRDYVRFTGDHHWLDEVVDYARGGQTSVRDYLVECARAWMLFRTDSGLADYGEIDNLLECVSSYVHEVASLNAANVFNLRVAADFLRRNGEDDRAAELTREADRLLNHVRALYVDGEGYWNARQPDGSLLPVRHCYDLATIGLTIPDDLDERVRREMIDFFHADLATPTWMRALSAADPDAMFSMRPDHQWNGAYCAWPSESALALLALGDDARTMRWIEGLAASASQGPFGQAHFIEDVAGLEGGGAPKVPNEMPFINDWACSSGGSWASLVIEGVFGIEVDVDGNVTATPRLGRFDPKARLRGLRVGGRTYDIDASGVHERVPTA